MFTTVVMFYEQLPMILHIGSSATSIYFYRHYIIICTYKYYMHIGCFSLSISVSSSVHYFPILNAPHARVKLVPEDLSFINMAELSGCLLLYRNS